VLYFKHSNNTVKEGRVNYSRGD